jgi:uncharacterized protein HemY
MAEGRQWLEGALAEAEGAAPSVRAKAVFAAGYAALGLGDFAGAEQHFEHCLALARDLGDERLEGAALAQLGWLAMTTDRRRKPVRTRRARCGWRAPMTTRSPRRAR